MTKKLMPFVFAGLLFQGCNDVAQPNIPMNFYTPSKLSVVKEGSKIYIQNLHNYKYKSTDLINGINEYFKKDNIFKIVDNIKSADIVIGINTFYSYRTDNSSDTKYNKKYFVKREIYRNSRGKETGGKDLLITSNHSASTATLISTISIYDKKNLEPLVYFNITPTDTSTKIFGKDNTLPTSNSQYNEKFTEEVIKKINDLITTKVKKANIFLPNNSNAAYTKLLLNTDFNALYKSSKDLLPSFDVLDISVEQYEEINQKASVKGSKTQARNMEVDLSNYYIYMIAKESTDLSAANIIKVYKSYKKIIALTKNESLILACANSLGRIEFKADRLKINLGDE